MSCFTADDDFWTVESWTYESDPEKKTTVRATNPKGETREFAFRGSSAVSFARDLLIDAEAGVEP